jgi:hypothetical protein
MPTSQAPSTSVLDAFNRANENPLSDGGSWDALVGALVSDLKLVSNAAVGLKHTTNEKTWGAAGGLADSEAFATITPSDLVEDFAAGLDGNVWKQIVGTIQADGSGRASGNVGTTSMASYVSGQAGDGYSQATVIVLPGAGNGEGPCLNVVGTTNATVTGYYAYGEPTQISIFRMNGDGTLTQLGSSFSHTLAINDVIKIRRSGSSVIATLNGTDIITVTDSTYTTGDPGIRIRGTTGRLDNFNASDTNNVGVVCRHNTTGNTGQTGYIATALSTYVSLDKQSGSGSTRTLTNLGTAAQTVGAGDQIAVQAISSSINLWYKASGGSWTLLISVTDSSYASGKIGIESRGIFSTLDDFGGGTVILTIAVPFIATATQVFAPALVGVVAVPFIASATTIYAPAIVGQEAVPFIASVTVVYAPTLTGAATEVDVPFISSRTHVWAIFAIYDPNKTFGGPGNGGESFLIRLNANGVTDTATLATGIGVGGVSTLLLTGDGAFPTDKPFVVTIDDEVLLIYQIGPGNYHIRLRAVSNTTASSHTAGANVDWGDSYDMAIRAGFAIANSFTADINSTGTFTYPGWLICFDSTQAYDDMGARYPMHVTQLLGVFDAGAGSSGSNRCDGAQPNAISTATGTSDDCPAALCNPARIASDIDVGDVAVLRYTNPEATILDLGGRSTALQSWFGLKRVSTSDVDVTFTDPNGIVVDTTGTYDTFTGSVNGEWGEPIPLLTGIAPDASDAVGHAVDTPGTVPWTTVTLPHADRFFTLGSSHGGYDETGWPMCCLAVRQGNRRVPFWQSWDWHDYAYVYDGFGTDCTYAQILINRNGIVFDSVPVVELPGNQDIPGPDAVWDDATYFVGASWFVAIFNTPYLVFGPGIGGTVTGVGGGATAPGVGFGGGTTPGGPVISVPPHVEGGSGGGIEQPVVGLHVWQRS